MLPTLKTLLHPTDLEAHSTHVLRYAASLAEKYGAKLVLLHVIEPLTDDQLEVIRDLLPQGAPDPLLLRDEAVKQLLARLEQRIDSFYRTEIPDAQQGEVEIIVAEGIPAKVILREAENHDADLIIMGHHEHSVFGQMLLSVAHKVIHSVKRPVLMVPQQRL